MSDNNWHKAAKIIRDAGGMIVGRTRLQKTAYFLQLAGFEDAFAFSYGHYGPYSEDLADAMSIAGAFDLVMETRKQTEWGSKYSIYSIPNGQEQRAKDDRSVFTERVAKFDAVELELAATAAYLSAVDKCKTPWEETARLKPSKANSIPGAQAIYREILKLKTPNPLPQIA